MNKYVNAENRNQAVFSRMDMVIFRFCLRVGLGLLAGIF